MTDFFLLKQIKGITSLTYSAAAWRILYSSGDRPGAIQAMRVHAFFLKKTI